MNFFILNSKTRMNKIHREFHTTFEKLNFIRMKKLLLITVTIYLLQICDAQTDTFDYFGQNPPGDTLEVFAPGIFSIEGRREKDIAIFPAGDEISKQQNISTLN